jgi:catechol 2,3-dioxygenase-like lactoylglutathione lyase family enzyme
MFDHVKFGVSDYADHGAPGVRAHYHPNYYAAFVIGPDGHNIEVVCQQPESWRKLTMSEQPRFKAAYPYQEDVLALTVKDLDVASAWYAKHFGMREVERRTEPFPAVVLERDGLQLGFEINGGDAEQDGAAILVSGIAALREELEGHGVETGNWRVDERRGQKFQVFFVTAPDGLCYYFHEPLPEMH